MTEVLLPPWIVPEEETQEWLDEGSSVFSAAFAPGIAQRQSFGGLRLKLSRRHTVRGEEKAQLLSILNLTRGRYNVLRTKVHFALRGSGLGSELIPNNTFANGVTGWDVSGETASSVADRVFRATRTAVTANQFAPIQNPAVVTTLYAPYVARFFVTAGRGAYPAGLTLWDNQIGARISSTFTSFGMLTGAHVGYSGAQARIGILDESTSGIVAGDYFNVHYASYAPCPLVDNGANLLLQSDEFDTTWTTNNATVDDQSGATLAPDGTATADALEENTTNGFHYVQQSAPVSSASGDYCFGVAIKAGSRGFAFIEMSAGASSATVYADINGVALASTSAGADWANARAFIVNAGNGWVVVYLVARKTTSATSVTARVGSATALGTGSYAGVNGNDAIYLWRGTLAQSSVPTRLVQTTTTASTGTSQTGNSLPVKGLPASTNGLLLPGDYFEINGEIKQATAALNSDAAGLGYLQFEPALVRSPADNDPINVTDPMGKFLVSNIKVDNRFGTDAIVTYDLEHIYE